MAMPGGQKNDHGAMSGGEGGQEDPSSVVAPSALAQEIASHQSLSPVHEDNTTADGHEAGSEETTQVNLSCGSLIVMPFSSVFFDVKFFSVCISLIMRRRWYIMLGSLLKLE